MKKMFYTVVDTHYEMTKLLAFCRQFKSTCDWGWCEFSELSTSNNRPRKMLLDNNKKNILITYGEDSQETICQLKNLFTSLQKIAQRETLFIEKKLVLKTDLGLHARSSQLLQKLCKLFNCNIIFLKDNKIHQSNSIMDLMEMWLEYGDRVIVRIIGIESKLAVRALEEFFNCPKTDDSINVVLKYIDILSNKKGRYKVSWEIINTSKYTDKYRKNMKESNKINYFVGYFLQGEAVELLRKDEWDQIERKRDQNLIIIKHEVFNL